METNPYSAPVAMAGGGDLFSSSGLVSDAAIQKLAGTKPWVRLVSVLSFIGSGFTMLMAAAMFVMGTLGSFAAAGRSGAALPAGFALGLAIIYTIVAIVQLYPGVKLWKYASAIARLMQSHQEEDLVHALDQQRGFWRFIGIIIVTFIALYIVTIAVVIVFGFASTMQMKSP